jgi:methylthioribulose-1-phosphate dehydratase
MMKSWQDEYELELGELIDTGRFLAAKGWSPASCSNISLRLSDGQIALVQENRDRHRLTVEDVLLVDDRANVITPDGVSAPVDARVHTTLYRLYNTGAVIHTHSRAATVLSMKHAGQGMLELTGYELLCAIRNHSHADEVEPIPIFQRDRNVDRFCQKLETSLFKTPGAHAFMISGYGLYSWGENLSEAKQQIEALEFILDCELAERMCR